MGNCNKYLGIKTRVGTYTLVIYIAGSIYSKYSICSYYYGDKVGLDVIIRNCMKEKGRIGQRVGGPV